MNFGEKKMYERKLVVGKRKLFIRKKTFVILLLDLNRFKCDFINLAIKNKREP